MRTGNGRRCFVKAVSEQANPDTPDLHRREAEVVAAIPVEAPVPRLLWTYDHGGWVALGFEDVDEMAIIGESGKRIGNGEAPHLGEGAGIIEQRAA